MRKTTEIFIPIPKRRNTKIKVEVSGVDLTSRVVESLWAYPCTSGIGTFRIVLSNSNGQLNNLYFAGDEAKFYADNTDATTLQFYGIIDSVKDKLDSNGQFLEIEGRHRSYLLTEYLVCYSSTGKVTSTILKELVDDLPLGYDFTYTNVETAITTMDVEWNYKPFWDCIVELCNKAGFDCYVDNDLDIHYFEADSKENEADFVAEGSNFLNSKYFGTDTYYEKTRVIAMGNTSGGFPIIHTAVSETEENGMKEVFVADVTANTMTKVKDIAEAKLAEVTGRAPQALIESFGLESLAPGENMWIIVPRQQIYGQYKVIQINHKFGSKSGGWRTECILEEEEEGIAKKIQEVNRKSEMAINRSTVGSGDLLGVTIRKYDYSWNFDYSSDTGTHTDTEIVDGVLQTTGGATGVWESGVLELDEDVIGLELRIGGTALAGVTGEVSTNSGRSYTKVFGVGAGIISLQSGRNLRVKVNLASANTQINDLVLLYS